MYDWPVETALAICKLESQGVAKATNWNDSHNRCTGSFGLMQIACVHGVSTEKLYIPEVNIKVAYELWRTSGFTPWTTYKKLAHK